MKSKNPPKSPKLSLKKETIRDLTVRTNLRAGKNGCSHCTDTGPVNCGATHNA